MKYPNANKNLVSLVSDTHQHSSSNPLCLPLGVGLMSRVSDLPSLHKSVALLSTRLADPGLSEQRKSGTAVVAAVR